MNIGPWNRPPEDPGDGEEKYPLWVPFVIIAVFGYLFWFVLIPVIFGGERKP